MVDKIKKDAPEQSDEKLSELEELKNKSEEYLNGWKRERADFINYKKEEIERVGQLAEYTSEKIILKIIPILDNIYLAEAHMPEELKDNKWTDGFLQIKNLLCDFLKKEGIEEIKAIDEPFDPNTMEAIEEVEGGEKGMVSEEAQRGYTLNGKVIRAAKVKIIK